MIKILIIITILFSSTLFSNQVVKTKEGNKKEISDIYINSMKKAESYFNYGKYDKTITFLLPLLKNRYELNKELILKLYEKLALSYFNLKDKKNAEFYIKRIFLLNYDYQFDPVFIPPEFIEYSHTIFEANQKEFLDSKNFIKKMIEKKDPDRYKIRTKKLYKNFIPGVGQFQNDHSYKGGIIITSEVLFGLTSMISYGLLKYYQKEDYTYENTDLANLGKIANTVSVIGFVTVYAYSVVDSLIYYNASKVEVIQYSRLKIYPIITPSLNYVSFELNF